MRYKTVQALMMAALLAGGTAIAAEPKKGCIDRPSAPVKKCVGRDGNGPRAFPMLCDVLTASAMQHLTGMDAAIKYRPSKDMERIDASFKSAESQCQYALGDETVALNIKCAYAASQIDDGKHIGWMAAASAGDPMDGAGERAVWAGHGLSAMKGVCVLEVRIPPGSALSRDQAAAIANAVLEHY